MSIEDRLRRGFDAVPERPLRAEFVDHVVAGLPARSAPRFLLLPRVVAVAATLALFAAAVFAVPRLDRGQGGAVGSPGVTPTTAIATRGPTPSGTWGPLAVVALEDSKDRGTTRGTLRVTASCTFLANADGLTTLVWPADRTTWNADTRTISFRNPGGNIVTVRDGHAVAIGGSPDSTEADPQTTEEWLARRRWVARPDASCPLDERYRVDRITQPPDPDRDSG